MPAANVPMIIDQGEDWSVEIVWTDFYNEPVPLVSPARMDIKNGNGATQISLITNPDIPDGEIPGIAISSNIGLIQLHISKTATAAMNPGEYMYDLFVTANDGSYAGPQVHRLLYGSITVNKRVTTL